MPTPTVITDLSTTAASNFPAGSDAPSTIDDVLRAHAAFLASIRDNSGNGWTSLYATKAAPALTGAGTSTGSFLLTGTGALGYGTGSGGTVTQATSKSTGVTLNKTSGQIVTHDESLANGATAAFIVTNSTVAATDTVVANFQSVPANAHTVLDYQVWAGNTAAGSFYIAIRNQSGGALAEAVTLNFAVIKAVTS
jgi:hypothetical protein